MKPATKPALASFATAAEILDVSKTHIYNLVDNGDLPFVDLGTAKRSMRKIPIKALEEFIQEHTQQVGT
jgi:excisionase family DNA binding protein